MKLDRITVQTVSPTLGKSSLQAGLISGLVGLALVMLYTIFYYRLLGMWWSPACAVTGALLWSIIAIMGQASAPPSTWPASSVSSSRWVSPSTPTSSISSD